MLFALPLIYVAVAYLVAGWLLVDTALARRLCVWCGTPNRESLIAVVAAVLWPYLAVCYVLGLIWWTLRLVPPPRHTW